MRRQTFFWAIILIVVGMFFVFSLGYSQSSSSNEQITLTTYYPSPYGVYKDLRLYPHRDHSGVGTKCTENGVMYYNEDSDTFLVCQNKIWVGMGGYWAGSGTDIYNINIGNVGIGTSTPSQKLEVAGNLKLSGGRSVIFTQGDNDTTHVGGVQFLTMDNGKTNIWTPTDASGTPVDSTIRFGGLDFNSNDPNNKQGAFNTKQVNLYVSGGVRYNHLGNLINTGLEGEVRYGRKFLMKDPCSDDDIYSTNLFFTTYDQDKPNNLKDYALVEENLNILLAEGTRNNNFVNNFTGENKSLPLEVLTNWSGTCKGRVSIVNGKLNVNIHDLPKGLYQIKLTGKATLVGKESAPGVELCVLRGKTKLSSAVLEIESNETFPDNEVLTQNIDFEAEAQELYRSNPTGPTKIYGLKILSANNKTEIMVTITELKLSVYAVKFM